MSNPDTLFFVNIDNILPEFDEACKLVKNAGGLVFVPHIFEYRENSEKILKDMVNNTLHYNYLEIILLLGLDLYYEIGFLL